MSNMEADEDQLTTPVPAMSTSFSPKVTRPKLPPSLISGVASRSLSPHSRRNKSEPGLGAGGLGTGEINRIIDDIKSLKMTDWKGTFSRPLKSALDKKSVSANTSPSHTPRRIMSPEPEDLGKQRQLGPDDGTRSLTRDRSRSLKILTFRLKCLMTD